MIDKEILQQSCIEFKNNPVTGNVTWEDCTSYSINDKEKIPTAFSTKIGDMRIVITCGHIYAKQQWSLWCSTLYIVLHLMKVETAKDAAEMAIIICKEKTEKMYKSFSEVILNK